MCSWRIECGSKEKFKYKRGYLNGFSRGHFKFRNDWTQQLVMHQCQSFDLFYLELTSACKRINKDACYEFVTYRHGTSQTLSTHKKSAKFNILVWLMNYINYI